VHTPDSAAELILGHVAPLESEVVALSAALDRTLAQDVLSPIDLPPWDNSAMDGYAVRSADLTGDPPHELHIVEEIAAGAFPSVTIAPGQCAKIFTGAPLPDGADGVIRQEDTTTLDAQHVRINETRDAGRNIRSRGEDVRTGDTVLHAGVILEPAHLGMLAAVAAFDVPVYRRPLVAILGSGNEIADVDERNAIVEGRKIASSNTYTLSALVQRSGARVLSLGIAKDDPADLRARLLNADPADLVVTTAGISVGEHDYLLEVLDGLGLDKKFWRIRMRPGAPVGFGLIGALGDVPWIGLPGNPVSTMVTFELFVRPAIRRMLGHTALFRRVTPVTAADPVTLGPPLRHFLRVTLTGDPARPAAYLTGPQGSHMLSSMVHADALMIVPEDKTEVRVGDVLDAIVLDDPKHVEECPW
jgi:molybdopterin molybdotransferase